MPAAVEKMVWHLNWFAVAGLMTWSLAFQLADGRIAWMAMPAMKAFAAIAAWMAIADLQLALLTKSAWKALETAGQEALALVEWLLLVWKAVEAYFCLAVAVVAAGSCF